MKIKLGIMPLASGKVQSLQAYSDGTVRLEFKTDSGKNATLIMDTDEAQRILADLHQIFSSGGV